MPDVFRISAHESLFIVDGGRDAELPQGSIEPVLAGPEAIVMAGRVACDAPTLFRVASRDSRGDLLLAYSGVLSTPSLILRVVTAEQYVLGEVPVAGKRTAISIFVTDLEEPDEILVALEPGEPGPA